MTHTPARRIRDLRDLAHNIIGFSDLIERFDLGELAQAGAVDRLKYQALFQGSSISLALAVLAVLNEETHG